MSRPRKKAGFSQGIYEQSATQKERIGTVRELDDGRTFVYCKNGAGALLAGNVLGAVTTAGMTEDTVTVAHAVGTTRVTMTDAGAGTAVNAYAGGRLVVNDGGGAGEVYDIVSNTAAAAGLTFELVLETGLTTAWVIATTDITVYPNKYNGVVANPADGERLPVGVAQRPVTAAYYFWAQVLGDGSMLLDVNGAAAGLEVDEKIITPSLNHAGFGYIDGSPDAAAVLVAFTHTIGYAILELDQVDNEASLVNIRIGL
jgi:hypothetical protein